jgi:O-antigen/teichoic acid export membrane protein
MIFNTFVLFARMGVTFGIGLYVTRLLLLRLGASDFGILAAVGATAAALTALSHSMNVAAQRHLAHALGRCDAERLRIVFNATVVLFLGIAALMLLAGLLVQRPILSALEIPAGRERAALEVYWFSLATLALVVLGTPFRAVVEARQAMGQIAAFDTLRSLLHLAAAVALFLVERDPLPLYASLVLLSQAVRGVGMALLAALRFPEARPSAAHLRLSEVRRVGGFAGWTTLLSTGLQAHNRAGVMLLGMAFSPVVTAGYAIAMNLRNYQQNFVKVFPRVAQPAMTAMEARGDRGLVQALALWSGKYAAVGASFLVVPLLIETEGVLRMWLRTVPPDAVVFARITLAWMTIHVLSEGFERAVIARGDVRRYALSITSFWIASIALSCLWFFGLGLPPVALPLTVLGVVIAQIPLRVVVGGWLVGIPARRWLRETVWPVVLPAAPAAAVAMAIHALMADGLARYLAVGLGYATVAAPLVWHFSIGVREKRPLERAATRALERLGVTVPGRRDAPSELS